MKPEIQPAKMRTLKLQNALNGHADFGKRIELGKVNEMLHCNHLFQSSFDTDSNPFQNYVQIKICHLEGVEGSIWIYSNGTAKTNIGLSNELLISLTDFLYKMYLKECLKEVIK